MCMEMFIFADSLFVEVVILNAGNMVKYLYYLCVCCLSLLVCGCEGKGESEELPFSPYVEAFTSGTISRYTPVYLIFNQEIAADRMKPPRLSSDQTRDGWRVGIREQSDDCIQAD